MANITWTNSNDFSGEQDKSGTKYNHSASSLVQGYEHYNLNKGLVAYYPMDYGQSTHVHDSTYNGNDGVVKGATRVSGQIGSGAFDFDGTDDHIDITGYEPIQNSISVSVWANIDSFGGVNRQMLYVADTSNRAIELRFDDNNSTFDWFYYDGANPNGVETPITQSTNQWYHICGTYDGTEWILYVDGVEIDRATTSIDITDTNATVAYIGKHDSYGPAFDGTIDEVRIYNRALSSGEVKALYNQKYSLPVVQTKDPRDGLVGEWRLDGDANDSVGTNDGAVNGASFVTAYKGQGADFNGNDYITGTFEDWNNFNAWTVSMWVNSSSTSDSEFFFHEEDGSYGRAKMSIRSSNWTFGVFDGSQTRYAIGSTAVANEWIHLVGVMVENDGIYLYENGKLQNKNSSFATQGPATANFVLGYNSGTNDRYVNGQIDEVRVYDRALTPVEVQRLYNLGQRKIPAGDNL